MGPPAVAVPRTGRGWRGPVRLQCAPRFALSPGNGQSRIPCPPALVLGNRIRAKPSQ